MKLGWKDAVDSMGFLLGLAIGVFLAFMPFLIDADRLTIKSCGLITSLGILASLLCFLFVKIANRQQEQTLRREEQARDRMLLEILRNQRKQMEDAHQTHSDRYFDVSKAATLYAYLLGEGGKSYTGAVLDRQQVEQMIQYETTGTMPSAMHSYAGRLPEASRERIRYLADLVASKALTSST